MVIDCRTDEIPGQAGDDMAVMQTATRRHARLDRASEHNNLPGSFATREVLYLLNYLIPPVLS